MKTAVRRAGSVLAAAALLLALAAGAVVCMPLSGPMTPRLGGTGRTTRLAGLAFAAALVFPTMMPSLAVLVAVGVFGHHPDTREEPVSRRRS